VTTTAAEEKISSYSRFRWTTKLIVYNSRQALDDFKQQLNAKFRYSDSGPA
jgi:hypothetical protein